GDAYGHICRRGFPTDFPMVGLPAVHYRDAARRGFPTDFPMVGSNIKHLDYRRSAVVSLPTSPW
ncbi:MAG: hypothetical protein ACLQKK_17535, partial [Rhodomicrobium sp.]